MRSLAARSSDPGRRYAIAVREVVRVVGGITVGRFDKDSQNRLLAVKEHLNAGSYQLGAGQTGLDRQTRQRGKATPGDTHGHRPRGANGIENGD